MSHPHEQLAEYVDGALDASGRAEVEAHLASCGVCRAEVASATSARQTLRGLPEVEPPPGTTMTVLREARETRTPQRLARPLRIAAAVVLLAGAAAGGIYAYGQLGEGAREPAPAADGGDAAERETEEPAAAPEEGSADQDARSGRVEALFSGPYPQVRRTGTEHTPDSIVSLAEDLRDEAREQLEAGFPQDAFAFYEAFPVASFQPAAREALACAGQGLEPERSVAPFVIEDASWEGRPAWVVSYLQGPEPAAAFDRVQILVVNREECALAHFAQQRLD
ncbi:MAG TPA: zf-HC2 domain-containing protein [Actinomycetota bacterium]